RELAMHLEKATLEDVELVLGSHIAIGRLRPVPIDETGRMLVNFGVKFGRASFDDLLLAREQLDRNDTPVHPPELFKNRLIVLARTDAASRTLAAPDGRKIAPG